MQTRGAACFIKLILISNHGRDWSWVFFYVAYVFFSFSCFVFLLLHLLPFYCRRNKTCGGSISSSELGDKTQTKLDVCERLTTLFRLVRRQVLWTWIFFPPTVQLLCSPWSKSSDWAPGDRADQPLNTNLLCLLFVSHFCQVWQLIKLK